MKRDEIRAVGFKTFSVQIPAELWLEMDEVARNDEVPKRQQILAGVRMWLDQRCTEKDTPA